jgi:hypothetical protein
LPEQNVHSQLTGLILSSPLLIDDTVLELASDHNQLMEFADDVTNLEPAAASMAAEVREALHNLNDH